MADPYADGVYRWWHLGVPSPELIEAEADGWLGEAGTALDLGCGLGAEAAHLAARGWKAVGVEKSAAALGPARREHAAVSFVSADVLALPFPAETFDVALDRGCFHYLSPPRWPDYAAETRRVLRPGGRMLLRACLTSQCARNAVTESGITRAFAGWAVDWMALDELRSDTRTMQALAARLRRE
jgi:SAM-dependent methyltransferase